MQKAGGQGRLIQAQLARLDFPSSAVGPRDRLATVVADTQKQNCQDVAWKAAPEHF